MFLSSDYGTGAALLSLERRRQRRSRRREVYFTNEMRNHHASSVLVGDYLYGFSSSILTAMQFDTGKVAWRDRSVGKGSVVVADNQLYLFSEDGVVGLADVNPARYVERGRFRLKTGNLPTWSHPVVVGRQALPARPGHDLRLRRRPLSRVQRHSGVRDGIQGRWPDGRVAAAVSLQWPFEPDPNL